MPIKTTLVCDKYRRTSYGIALTEICDDIAVVIEEFCDISQDMRKIVALARLCNELELDRSHFEDILDDFLAK